MHSLEKLIESRRAQVGIVGLGYVGLPLAVEFAGAGFSRLLPPFQPELPTPISTMRWNRLDGG